MSSRLSNDSVVISHAKIKTEALRSLGFSACGIVKPSAVDEAAASHFRSWLSMGYNADMSYMEGYEDKRLDPRLLMPEARSIICVALSYAPESDAYQKTGLSAYALGKDYHDVMKLRLRNLAERLGLEGYRVFCDTAPILERYLAVQAGLGWIGKNHLLIVPKVGSMFFLGEIFCQEECDEYDTPLDNHCSSTCRKCLDACPMGALREDGYFDARRCLSYLTIENRGDIPDEAAGKMGECFYGCDRCQLVCPHNANTEPSHIEEFFPSLDLLDMDMGKWRSLTIEQYRTLFKGSAVKRAKYNGLMRNISKIK